jgi:hypothetical protein
MKTAIFSKKERVLAYVLTSLVLLSAVLELALR